MAAQNLPSALAVDLDEVTADRNTVRRVELTNISEAEHGPPVPGDGSAPPRRMVERDALVDMLVKQLRDGDVAIYGPPAVGMSTLAVTISRHPELLAEFGDGVLWAGLGPNDDIMSVLAAWGGTLGIDVTDHVTPQARAEAVAGAIGQDRMLLVIDDAQRPEDAQLLRCGGPRCRHLLTTRDPALAFGFAAGGMVRVPGLDIDAASALLRERVPGDVALDAAAVRDLALATDGLPLTLNLLAGFLAGGAAADPGTERTPESADPHRRLALARLRLGRGGGHAAALKRTIALNLDDLDAPLVDAFHALGAFAPKPAVFDLEAAGAVTGASAETLTALIDRGLLEQTEAGRLALHETVADVARTRLTDEAMERHRAHYLAVIATAPEDWDATEAIYPQLRWAWRSLPERVALPTVLALLWACRDFQARRGLWQDILAWAKDALEHARSEGDLQMTALLLNSIGEAHDVLGDRRRALDHYEEALPLYRQAGRGAGEATILNNMGLDQAALGEQSRALESYQQALVLVREAGDRAGEATMLSNIAALHAALGDKPQALQYYEQALPILRQIGDKAAEAPILSSIGALHAELDDKPQALQYHQDALRFWRQLGNKAAQAMTLIDMGGVHDRLGEAPRALDCYEQALELCREIGDRWSESVTRRCLARLHETLGNLPEAEAHLREVLVLDEATGHPMLETNRADLARMQQQRRRKRPFWLALFGRA